MNDTTVTSHRRQKPATRRRMTVRPPGRMVAELHDLQRIVEQRDGPISVNALWCRVMCRGMEVVRREILAADAISRN